MEMYEDPFLKYGLPQNLRIDGKRKAKDKNGIFCADDSASHGCPIECDEAKGEVLCPTYENALGCKPKEICIPRPKNSEGRINCYS